MFPDFKDFSSKKEKIAIVGLGYVGLPLATLFGTVYDVIGYDTNGNRVEELKEGSDVTGEVSAEEIRGVSLKLTTDPAELKNAKLIIVTVPTPIDEFNKPDLTPIKTATREIGENLTRGSVVVYESTVYPGLTEEVCVPILEESSGLKWGDGFKVGYSPERISSGDKKHSLPNIVKIVSGEDAGIAKLLELLYGNVIKAGIHVAPSIKTAEAAKIVENVQRDLNIALMNELALIFNRLNIKTKDVLDAAGTKWNFHKYEPGLVGGHCLGVDPYYLTHKAEEVGYVPAVILSGLKVNNHIGIFIAEEAVKSITDAGKAVKGSKVLILGVTFKENVKDVRNTRTVDIYNKLKEFGAEPVVYDPWALPDDVKEKYGIDMVKSLDNLSGFDAILLTVKHSEFVSLDAGYLRSLCSNNPVLLDVKEVVGREIAEAAGFQYWTL